uniref:F-box domain-containing protein n=1 Tax=Aegilops tauschii TaxID=37682 RepID=M8ATW2_AEGTA
MTPFLPDEIIIWEILVHLDPRTLFCCRAVRRSWCLVTSTRRFLLAHHARQPALPIFPGDGQYRNILAFDHRATAEYQLHTVAPFDQDFDLEASCDGLLVLSKFESTTASRTFSVCNPATREHAYLRLPPWNFKTLAMYPHRPTGEYRLLLQRNWRGFTGLPKDQTCYIFALGSNRPPRSIAWPETFSAYLLNLPARLHDSLHWHPKRCQSDSEPVVIVFDRVNCKKPPQLRILIPKTVIIHFFSKNHQHCSDSFQKALIGH